MISMLSIKLVAIVIIYLLHGCAAPPPRPKPPVADAPKAPENDIINNLAYKDYLQEVTRELENDEAFAKEMQKPNKSNIALSLEMVHHKVRSKLDEIKRREVARLNLLESSLETLRAKGKIDPVHLSALTREHLDPSNHETFEVKDLENLIKRIHKDLNMVDKKEEEQFKQHEIEKEVQFQRKLNHTKDSTERERLKKAREEALKRHRDHPKLNHPGKFAQLLEVWQKGDKLEAGQYDPKTFFKLHDTNSDGHWDQNEIDALMQNELDKVYNENNTDDDVQERHHEMLRMRQEMMAEADKNDDGMITWDEFRVWTLSPKYKQEDGWKTVDDDDQNKPYNDDELKQYEKEHPDFENEEKEHEPADKSKASKPEVHVDEAKKPPTKL